MDIIKNNSFGGPERNPPYAGIRTKQLTRITSHPYRLLITLYLVMAVGAEILAISLGVLAGGILDGFLLVILINFSYFSKTAEIRQASPALALVPLMRILSFTVPVPHIYPIFWYAMIGIPLVLALLVIVYIHGLPEITRRHTIWQWISQLLFGLVGIPIGVLAGWLLPANGPTIPNTLIGWIIIGSIILTVFNAVTDEVIFRGLVQSAFTKLSPIGGLLISSGFYACMFIGTLNFGYLVFFGLVGLIFAVWVKITHSLWGVIIAHSIIDIIFLLLFIH